LQDIPQIVNKYPGLRIVGLISFFLLFLAAHLVSAQETFVQGKVTDANSGDPIPFVNVVFKGTTTGATTDFDGNFSIKTLALVDSVTASYIGYKIKTKAVKRGVKQTINFQLSEDVVNLQEVVVKAGENPAWEILRNIIRNKDKNDKRNLSAYEYDTYTKIEIDVDKISDEFRERKLMRKVAQVLDSVERIAGEDGKPVLPIFITESVSKLYFRDKPELKKEFIEKSKITGLGVEDGTSTIQLIGSSFQEYNFYQNWLTILTKDFVSPIADGWRLYYDYDLTDSADVGNDFCYRLDFYPKSQQALAFTGTMWITKKEFAIRQIDATVTNTANLNFVEKIRIQQELQPTELGPWLPTKNRVLIDVGELTPKSAGMLAKFYTSNKNFVVNRPHEPAFYERPIQVAEDALVQRDENSWDTLRHEPLSETEKNVYRMIDTLKNIPIIKTYTDIVKFVLDGYIKIGKKFELGPYPSFILWNNIEGIRLQAGFRTNINFSKKYVIGGQLGYGFNDKIFKYSAYLQKILSKDKWTTLTFRVRKDLSRLGVDDENLIDNPLFLTATRWGFFRRGYYLNESKITFQRELFKGFQQKVSVQYWTFDPTYNFGYLENPVDPAAAVFDKFQTAEVTFESRYARDELFIQDDNDRVSLGTNKSPVITFRYTHGVKGFLGSDFDYDKMRLSLTKRIKTGPLGVGYATLTGEYIFNTLPYPLLSLHLGNQSAVYSSVTYNLMNYGEFVSDHYASLQYRQYMEGFLLNRIPLLQKLKWRLLGTANLIMGGMRESNRNLISQYTPEGEKTLQAGYFSNKPYVELGYGVENIFRFLRIDFVHRLTYLDNPNARRFGVLFTAQLQL
jgi:hypothetical protein